MRAFLVSKNEQHPTDLAGLHTARLAVASETPEGGAWDEEKIKLVTGGDVVTARFMRGDFFDYVPKFKLWIQGNHAPTLRHVDVAIRRRFHLIPFVVQINPRNPDFKELLRPEWPGILRWAVEGCVLWQRLGLAPPTKALTATEEYFADQDTLGRWLSERTFVNPNAQTGSTAAFRDWKLWSEVNREYTGSQKSFSQAIQEKGFKRKKDAEGKAIFGGFSLKEGG
jgi:putative DNA primase/helicase